MTMDDYDIHGMYWYSGSCLLFCMVLQDPVARKFVLLVDFEGVGLGSLVPLTIVRDLMVVMQARGAWHLAATWFSRLVSMEVFVRRFCEL